MASLTRLPTVYSCRLVSHTFVHPQNTHSGIAANLDTLNVEEAGVQNSTVDVLGSLKRKSGLAANRLGIPVDSPLKVDVGGANVLVV